MSNLDATDEAAEAATGTGDMTDHQRETGVTLAEGGDLEDFSADEVSASSTSLYVQVSYCLPLALEQLCIGQPRYTAKCFARGGSKHRGLQ